MNEFAERRIENALKQLDQLAIGDLTKESFKLLNEAKERLERIILNA